MKKLVVVTLVIFTFIFFVAHRYLVITSCNTYNLKIYNNALYIKYGIRTNEKISNKFIGNLYGCRRYKVLSLNLNQKLKLENKTLLTKINEEYYLEIPFRELFSNRDVTLILKKIDGELGGSDENQD